MFRVHQNWFKKSKLSRLSRLGVAGLISCFAIIFTLGVMLFPSLPDFAQAVENGSEESTTYSASPTVGISLPNSIRFNDVTPTEEGATTTATTNLTVTTANSDGYHLYLYPSDGNTSLKSSNPANTSTIDAINNGGVGLTLSSLEPNTWGYNLGTSAPDINTTYFGMPADSATPIQSKDTSSTGAANDPYTLSFGAKVDSTLPSGEYSTTLTLSVVAEPRIVTITFEGNGADGGSMLPQKLTSGDTKNLSSNAFVRTGYEFIGWNTMANGTGTSYPDGGSYTASSASGEVNVTLYAQWKKLTFACTARYKLQNADGSYPDEYTTVTVDEAVEYGEVCSYTTTQDSSQYTNQSAQATVTSPTVLTVGTNGEVPRRTYTFTVTAGSNTSGATGSGTYRWGQTVTASVTKATDVTCISYATPTWSKNSGATGTLNSTSGTSITYTMGTTNDTITATSSASSKSQTITFYTSGGASSITLNGTSRTNGQTMSLTCGTYSLSGSFSSGYEFSSWSNSGGSIANRNTLSTTYTVNGPGTITLNGKSSIPPTPTGYMQDFTPQQCAYYASSSSYTLKDRRDNSSYSVRYINGNCWMTQNLRLARGRTLTSSDSNVVADWYFPTYDLTSGDSTTQARSHAGNTTTGYWYNYCAVSAGTNCGDYDRSSGYSDICPKGWRLPTTSDVSKLSGTSYISVFSPVIGGNYANGRLMNTDSGSWWARSHGIGENARGLNYSDGSLGELHTWKYYSAFARCVLSN